MNLSSGHHNMNTKLKPPTPTQPGSYHNPLPFLARAWQKQGDVVFLGQSEGTQTVLLCHPAHVKQVLQDNHRNYGRSQLLQAAAPLLGNGLVMSEGAWWQQQRRLMQPAFHRQQLAALAQTMITVIKTRLDCWAAAAMPLDIASEMKHLTMQIVVTTLFGFDLGDMTEGIGHTFHQVVAQLREQLQHKATPLSPMAENGFEASPDYLYNHHAAARIYRYDPQIKLIVLLRHPVERAYSEWNMHRLLFAGQLEPLFARILAALNGTNNLESNPLFACINAEIRHKQVAYFLKPNFLPFAESVRQEIEWLEAGETHPYLHYVHGGLYAQQLQRYLAHFDRQQIHIVDSRHLRSNPVQVLAQITHFLQLPEHTWFQEDLSLSQASYLRPLEPEIKQRLRQFYQPYNEHLYELIGYDFAWR